jgi:hypothetical protein
MYLWRKLTEKQREALPQQRLIPGWIPGNPGMEPISESSGQAKA